MAGISIPNKKIIIIVAHGSLENDHTFNMLAKKFSSYKKLNSYGEIKIAFINVSPYLAGKRSVHIDEFDRYKLSISAQFPLIIFIRPEQ